MDRPILEDASYPSMPELDIALATAPFFWRIVLLGKERTGVSELRDLQTTVHVPDAKTQTPIPAAAPPPEACAAHYFSTFRMARKASWGISTLPTRFMRFFPSACFCRSLRFRVTSPP